MTKSTNYPKTRDVGNLIPQQRREAKEVATKDAGATALPGDPSNGANVLTDTALPNGDDVDVRMAKIAEVLDHAATPHLEKCELVAEWVRHAEAKFSVSGQVDQKPGAGRPEGGISRAARELPLPGKSEEARRKFIQRAIDINCIWPEAKSAARKAKLDNIQSALLNIADERTPVGQLAKVAEIAARKGAPRRKPNPKDGGENAAKAPNTTSDQEPPEPLVAEEEAALAALQACWNDDRQLRRDDWSNAAIAVRRCFVRDVLLERPVSP
jgi:hypothetical protein